MVKDEETGQVVGPIPRLDEMFAWFKRNQVSDKATIAHGDFKIDNVVSEHYTQLKNYICSHNCIDISSY